MLAALAAGSAHAQNDEQRSTLADQQRVAITIYNNNLALIKDQRKLQLKPGMSTLAFRDVSAQMRPETALLRSLSSAGSLSVQEQNFDFDLLTPQSLLEKYVGQTVTVIRTNPATGQETSESAQVLATNSGVVLKIGNRIETSIPGRIVYDGVPPRLRDRPTLLMQLENTEKAQQDVELSYLSAGLGWKADYVVELSPGDDKLDISGWVTLTNTSGATYRNAKLQLVAGDVNRATQRVEITGSRVAPIAGMNFRAKAPMAEESLFEYHLYSLDHPTTIAENQTKQVALLSASGVPARKELLLKGASNYYQSSSGGDLGQKIKVGVFVEFDNKESSQLGMPLPKGIIRVYKKDAAGNAQFIGEDNVDHTPKNEKVRLKLGDAFDVTADRKQTDFKVVNSGTAKDGAKYAYVYESAYEIVIKNAKKEGVLVTVQEPVPGDWQVMSESIRHTKGSSNTAVWKVPVPAEGSTTLVYRTLVRY